MCGSCACVIERVRARYRLDGSEASGVPEMRGNMWTGMSGIKSDIHCQDAILTFHNDAMINVSEVHRGQETFFLSQ